jgi:hypothetical protein
LINATLKQNERGNFHLLEDAQENGSKEVVNCEHNFSKVFLKIPTWCHHCSTFIWGVTIGQQNAWACSGGDFIVPTTIIN